MKGFISTNLIDLLTASENSFSQIIFSFIIISYLVLVLLSFRRLFPINYLRLFVHFVGLALKAIIDQPCFFLTYSEKIVYDSVL